MPSEALAGSSSIEVERGEEVKEEEKKEEEVPRSTALTCLMLVALIACILAIIGLLVWFGITKSGNKWPKILQDDDDIVSNEDSMMFTMERLQREIGELPRVRLESFSNWDGTTRVPHVLVVTPADLLQIQKSIVAASRLGLRMRCVGTAHSYSDLFADEGQVVMETHNLVTRHDGPPIELHRPIWDNDLTVVTAAAGLVQEELVQFFIHNGVQMKSTSHEIGAMLGGIFSTGSRGEDIRTPPTSDQLVAMRIVDSSGHLRSYNIMQHPRQMAALKLCLGMCGVVYDLTIRVTPLEVVRATNSFPVQREAVFNTEKLRELNNNGSMMIYWSPLSSLTDAQWADYDATGKITREYNPIDDIMWLRHIEAPVYGVTPDSRFIIGNEIPQTVPGMEEEAEFRNGTIGLPQKSSTNATWGDMTTLAPPTTTEVPPAEEEGNDNGTNAAFSLKYHLFALMYTKANVPAEYYAYLPEAVVLTNGSALEVIYAVQWDFPDDVNFTTTINVLNFTLSRLAKYAYTGRMPVLTMIYKWHRKSPYCLLCPGHVTKNDSHVDHIFSLELVGTPSDPTYPKFVNEITSEWMRRWPNSTPNWAKWYKYIKNIKPYFRSSFGPSLKTFVNTLKDLELDPKQMFTNKVLRDIFYPTDM